MNGKLAMLNHIEKLVAATRTKPPMNTDNTHRQSLQQALAAVIPQEEVAEAIHRYDKLAKFGQAMAVEVTLKSIGLDEARGSVVADYLSRQLAKLGTAKIETDTVKRYRELVKRLNKAIQDGGSAITVDGKGLSQFEIEQAKVKVGECLQAQAYTYTAFGKQNVNGREFKGLALETIGVRTE